MTAERKTKADMATDGSFDRAPASAYRQATPADPAIERWNFEYETWLRNGRAGPQPKFPGSER